MYPLISTDRQPNHLLWPFFLKIIGRELLTICSGTVQTKHFGSDFCVLETLFLLLNSVS